MKRFMTWIVAAMLFMQTAAMAQEADSLNTDTTYDTSAEAPASETTVDQEVLPGDAVSFRTVPDSVVANLKRDDDFTYANDPEFWKKERDRITGQFKESEPGWFDILISRPWFKRLLLIAMVCLLVFAIIKIAISNRLMLRSKPKNFNGAEDDDVLQKDNLDNLVSQAEQQANFRLAVRYRYMRALQQMEARNIVQLDAKSTNWDYVNRMINHPLKKQFLLLTRAYEYVWYGEFALNGEQYQYLKTEFEQYNNSLA